ncbi:MAG: NAD(P)-dependent oxidoreductase [Pseudomonadota bacterium]
MDQAKSVLVTGATGFIGRATVVTLEQAGWRVSKGVRTSPAASGDIFLDLAQPAAILTLANEARFDAIVHLGAQVGLSDATEAEMFVPNVLASGCLAFLASQWQAHLIFASTAIVCGARTEMIDAGSPVVSDTAYAHTKWLGEQLLAASQAHHCILRVAGVFGPGGPAHLGLNRAIDGAMKGLPPTQVGAGHASRNYIYVKDVARAIAFALQGGLAGTHLLAGSEVMPVNEMLQEVCNTFLPGQRPLHKDGQEAKSQVIQPSPHLPKTRGFREALADIKDTRP